VLDSWNVAYSISTCNDCADLSAINDKVWRGGSFGGDNQSVYERTANRNHGVASSRFGAVGFRCARP